MVDITNFFASMLHGDPDQRKAYMNQLLSTVSLRDPQNWVCSTLSYIQPSSGVKGFLEGEEVVSDSIYPSIYPTCSAVPRDALHLFTLLTPILFQ
jgi:hypothetical protein